ncbi:MAG: DUF3822 family protein [Bacteroidia bacterium]|nr:DUF3822 family protein [Bacteroidia bacterium]
MNLSVNNENKKNVIAERIVDEGIPLNLCNLFVSVIDEFKVFSLYSALSKTFVGYKVVLNEDEYIDPILNQTYNAIYSITSNPDFEIVPKGFVSGKSPEIDANFNVDTTAITNEIHLAYGLGKLAQSSENAKIWIFTHAQILSIFIANHKQLVFANSFNYNDQTEILYFIINALSIAQINQNEADLFIDYSASKKFGLIEFLEPYFKSVSKLSVPFENPDPEIENLPYLLSINHMVSLCV